MIILLLACDDEQSDQQNQHAMTDHSVAESFGFIHLQHLIIIVCGSDDLAGQLRHHIIRQKLRVSAAIVIITPGNGDLILLGGTDGMISRMIAFAQHRQRGPGQIERKTGKKSPGFDA